MNQLFFLAAVASMFGLGMCGNYTVTDEAWFEVVVEDMDGDGQDYRGRFTVALFGESAPMTVMNFAAITRGYSRGGVSLHCEKEHIIAPRHTSVQMRRVTLIGWLWN